MIFKIFMIFKGVSVKTHPTKSPPYEKRTLRKKTLQKNHPTKKNPTKKSPYEKSTLRKNHPTKKSPYEKRTVQKKAPNFFFVSRHSEWLDLLILLILYFGCLLWLGVFLMLLFYWYKLHLNKLREIGNFNRILS